MSADIFTRRIMGMDYRVWLAMLITCCSTIALFGYKHISNIKVTPCVAATITVDGKPMENRAVCYLGRLTMFKIQAEGITKVEWDFKDGTDEVKGQIVTHEFANEGDYKIIATINGHCLAAGIVTVKKPLRPGDGEKRIIRIFPEPTQPKVGSVVDFYVVSNVKADSYQWKLLGTDQIRQSDVARFQFNEPGNYTVQLIINNDPSTATTEAIEVFALTPEVPQGFENGVGTGVPGPVGPPPVLVDHGIPHSGGTATIGGTDSKKDTGTSNPAAPKTKPVDVDPNTFMGELQEVIYGSKDIEDLYRYLDYKGSTMVKVNEETTLISLKEFCKKMKNEKRKRNKIETLGFKKDDKNSIQTLLVKVSKKEGLLDKLWPFN